MKSLLMVLLRALVVEVHDGCRFGWMKAARELGAGRDCECRCQGEQTLARIAVTVAHGCLAKGKQLFDQIARRAWCLWKERYNRAARAEVLSDADAQPINKGVPIRSAATAILA